MNQGITLDISARVTGYESSLRQLQQAASKIDIGTEIGKSISRELERAEKQVKSLGNNLTPKVTNTSQLDNLVNKINSAGDSIQRVVELMNKVGVSDINFAENVEIDGLTQQLAQLEAQLTGKISSDFQNLIQNTEFFARALKYLNIDAAGKTPGEIFEQLAQKAGEAEQAVSAAEKSLASAKVTLAKNQSALDQAKASPINNKDEVISNLQTITAKYTSAIEQLREKLQVSLSDLFKDNPKIGQKLLDAFLKDLSPINLSKHLSELMKGVRETFTNMSAVDVYKTLFGEVGELGKSSNIAAKFVSTFFPSAPEMEEMKANFQQLINEISTSFTAKQVGNIKELISKGNIQEALNVTIKNLENAYTTLQGRITQLEAKLFNSQKGVTNAENNLTINQNISEYINGLINGLQSQIQQVVDENRQLQNQINSLKAQIEGKKSESFQNFRRDSSDVERTLQNYKLTNEEVSKYQTKLDQVHAEEQLVGKLQGVVQRWFSIYAAVRMVGNAVKSVISTLQELDKTITEIAIVTNMTQQELWGQMSSYTNMARQYASSISGVYKVSQLYYQQGKLNI